MIPADEDVERASIVAVGLLVGSLLVYRLAETVADPDLWGHVVFGKQILSTSRMVQPDLYSYITLGLLWTNHEWLIDVVFATLFDTFGPRGLIGLKLAVTLVICGLLYGHFRRSGLTRVRASILLIVFVVAMMPWVITVRAQLATYLLFLLTLLVLRRASVHGVWPLWKLPLLFFDEAAAGVEVTRRRSSQRALRARRLPSARGDRTYAGAGGIPRWHRSVLPMRSG